MKQNIITTIGCDLGDKKTAVCVLDDDGNVTERGVIKTTRPGFKVFFEGRKASLVVLEVGTHSRWVSQLITALGHDVIVANARKVRLIYGSTTKHDRFDAEALARLGRVDPKLLGPIQHRDDDKHAALGWVRSRALLVDARTKLVNHVRSVVKSFGHRLPVCSTEAFHNKAKGHIPDELKPMLNPLLVSIEHHTVLIRSFDKQLTQIARERFPDTERLMQVNGVGELTSLTFVLTLGDATRFRRARDVGPYIGLTPRIDQSGASNKQLRISKAGDGYLRKLLVTAAQHILGPFGKESDLRTFGKQMMGAGKSTARKKKAVIAVARKLAVLLFKLWTSGDDYVAVGYARKAAA